MRNKGVFWLIFWVLNLTSILLILFVPAGTVCKERPTNVNDISGYHVYQYCEKVLCYMKKVEVSKETGQEISEKRPANLPDNCSGYSLMMAEDVTLIGETTFSACLKFEIGGQDFILMPLELTPSERTELSWLEMVEASGRLEQDSTQARELEGLRLYHRALVEFSNGWIEPGKKYLREIIEREEATAYPRYLVAKALLISGVIYLNNGHIYYAKNNLEKLMYNYILEHDPALINLLLAKIHYLISYEDYLKGEDFSVMKAREDLEKAKENLSDSEAKEIVSMAISSLEKLFEKPGLWLTQKKNLPQELLENEAQARKAKEEIGLLLKRFKTTRIKASETPSDIVSFFNEKGIPHYIQRALDSSGFASANATIELSALMRSDEPILIKVLMFDKIMDASGEDFVSQIKVSNLLGELFKEEVSAELAKQLTYLSLTRLESSDKNMNAVMVVLGTVMELGTSLELTLDIVLSLTAALRSTEDEALRVSMCVLLKNGLEKFAEGGFFFSPKSGELMLDPLIRLLYGENWIGKMKAHEALLILHRISPALRPKIEQAIEGLPKN